MSCMHIKTENRQYPLRQPEGWKAKYPRWMLQLPADVNELSITYIGVQPRHEDRPSKGIFTNLKAHTTTAAQIQAAIRIENWILHESALLKPELWEKFYVETGYDVPDTEVWVLYWTNRTIAEAALADLDLQRISRNLYPDQRSLVGLWRESFTVSKMRFETIYSGNDYQPGVASLEGASQVPHNYTGYWGAARDRLPASSYDAFLPKCSASTPDFEKDTKNRIVSGQNGDQILHIRSGQYWERCTEDEQKAYTDLLERVLRKGMAYLEDNAAETGDCGLRFMRNIVSNHHVRAQEMQISNGSSASNDNGYHNEEFPRRRLETCSAGFFRSLKDLELWAAKHQTHQKIFHGAHAHSTRFGKETFKMRTWHEVSLLKPGEVLFEYVNCEPRTGLMPFVEW